MRKSLAAGVVALALLVAPVSAAQDDPRLDVLFAALLATRDEGRARLIESYIWSIWLEAHDDTLDRLMRLGMRDMGAGSLDSAIRRFSTIVERAPDFAEGWNKRATVYYMAGRFEESIADCMRVLALEPRHFGALSGLGLIHLATDAEEQALVWFRRALERNPHMPAVRRRVDALAAKLEGQPI